MSLAYPNGPRDAWPGDHLRYEYLLNENSIVIDLGCHYGLFTENINKKFNCFVYAFEPLQRHFDICQQKFKDNSRIKLYKSGLSDKNQVVDFTTDGESSTMFSDKTKAETNVQLIKFEDFLLQENISQIDLLKMNIEGGEYDLLIHLINNNLTSRIKNIQVQFHENAFLGWRPKYNFIQENLLKTHYLTYKFEFKFENWQIIT